MINALSPFKTIFATLRIRQKNVIQYGVLHKRKHCDKYDLLLIVLDLVQTFFNVKSNWYCFMHILNDSQSVVLRIFSGKAFERKSMEGQRMNMYHSVN